GEKFLRFIDDHHEDHFVAFFHTAEPDKLGHLYGENSLEYHEGGLRCDRYLGLILDKLEEHDIMNETLVYVCTDHGFLEDGFEHPNEPLIWLVSNDLRLEENVDETRLFIPDIAATIYRSLGIDVTEPPLRGYPLQSPLPSEAEQRMAVWEDKESPELGLEILSESMEYLELGMPLELRWTVSDNMGLTKTYLAAERHGVDYFNGSVGDVLYESEHIPGSEAEFIYALDLPFNESMYDVTVYAFDVRENLTSRTIILGTDTLPPVIESTSFYENQIIYKDYNLWFIVADNAGLSQADVRLNGETVESYSFNDTKTELVTYLLDVSEVPNGVHSVTVLV
ncbi:alkaline phosphatase family protein, partial [Candidatus Bathyarchaeota archaeon]|nr:alkaline phosphatase family protein [Candidatus Bathyarchaeota archaeon]